MRIAPLLIPLVWLVAGCALTPAAPPALAACMQRYDQLDARLTRAGIEDQGSLRVPGFPYLRSTRFLASFRDELQTDAERRTWIEHLRQLDLRVRELELRNLGEKPAEILQELDDCSRRLAALDLRDPDRFALLQRRAAVPDDYSTLRRVLGLYPLAAPFLSAGIGREHAGVRRDYARPTTDLDQTAPLLSWVPPAPQAPVTAAEAAAWQQRADGLGIPSLSEHEWQRLLETHAPSFRIEFRSENDRPGQLQWQDGHLVVDTREAPVYVRHDFTRMGGEVLPQLIYVIWFSARTAERFLDPYAGWLDGLVWRVTLGADGRPLLYDSMHPCGCYHMFFPARPLRRKAMPALTEPILVPQDEAPAGPVLLHVAAGTHALRRVLPARKESGAQRYTLLPYARLQALPDRRGRTRSIFGRGGLIEGSERLERLWLWPSGVISPGAMRQAGRHATAFLGMRHFDDPFLLDRLFEMP